MDSLSKKDESKLGAFTSLLESFGGLDLDEPPEVEDKEILKVSVKKTEKPKEISEVKVVDEVKVDDLPSEPQLKLSNKDQEKLSSFAGLMESFGALLDEPPQLEDEKVFEMKVEDVYPEENKEKIEEKKKIETSKLMAFEKLFTEFTKEQEKIDKEVLNLKVTDIYPEKQDEDFTHYPAQVDPKKDKSGGWIKGDPTKPIMFDGSDGKTTKDIIKKANKEVERERKVKREPYFKNPKDKVEETSNIIEKVISNLDTMKGKTQVKEQVDQITSLRNEFNQFRTVIQNQIANQKISYAGGGSGEVRLEFLDDVDRDTAKVDGKYLKYNSTTGKFIGSDPNAEAEVLQYSADTQTYTVTVATKAATHPYYGTGSSNGYLINGLVSPYLNFIPRNTYRFDQSDSSNDGHPLRFYYDVGKTTQYTSGVTTSGTPGNSGAYTQIVPTADTPPVLYYQCSSHGNMGWAIFFNTRNLTGFDSDDLTEGSTNKFATNEVVQDIVGAMVSSNTETDIAVTYNDTDGKLNFVVSNISGNAATATALASARTIGGVSFDGTANINLPGVNTTGDQDTSGNASTASTLATARTIHGVSFDGSGNIDLTEVIQDTVGAMFSSNTETGITATYEDGDGTIDLVVGTLNQDTTGTAALATAADTIKTNSTTTNDTFFVTFVADNNGSATAETLFTDGGMTYNPSTDTLSVTNITATITGTSSLINVADESSDTTCFPVFVTGASGNLAPKSGSNLAFNSSSGALTATSFVDGNGETMTGGDATALAIALG